MTILVMLVYSSHCVLEKMIRIICLVHVNSMCNHDSKINDSIAAVNQKCLDAVS